MADPHIERHYWSFRGKLEGTGNNSFSGTTTIGTGATLTTPTITNPEITQPQTSYTADGAVTITSHTALLGKSSAAAMTLAAPGAAGVGKRITFTTITDFAHVVTFTGGTLWDGTAGANSTWTSAAVQGSSLTVEGISATKWNVVSFNLGTIAP